MLLLKQVRLLWQQLLMLLMLLLRRQAHSLNLLRLARSCCAQNRTAIWVRWFRRHKALGRWAAARGLGHSWRRRFGCSLG